MTKTNYIAVDLGASSGRVMLAVLDNEKISLQEIHRFPNGPVEEDGALHWDFKVMFGQITAGIGKALEIEKNIQSIVSHTQRLIQVIDLPNLLAQFLPQEYPEVE